MAVLIGNRDFRVYEIRRDDSIIDYLFAEGINFWKKYIETDTLPPARTLEDVENIHHGEAKARKFADDSIIEAVKRYAALDEQVKAIKKEQEELKIKICDAIGDAVGKIMLAHWASAAAEAAVKRPPLRCTTAPRRS